MSMPCGLSCMKEIPKRRITVKSSLSEMDIILMYESLQQYFLCLRCWFLHLLNVLLICHFSVKFYFASVKLNFLLSLKMRNPFS
jgi:hypothetical protein